MPRNRVKRLLDGSLSVSLDKARDRAVSAVTDEVINFLHQENLNLDVFKEMIKNSGECQAISKDVIDR